MFKVNMKNKSQIIYRLIFLNLFVLGIFGFDMLWEGSFNTTFFIRIGIITSYVVIMCIGFYSVLEEFKDIYQTKNFVVATIQSILWSVGVLALYIVFLAIILDILGIA